MAYQLTIEGLCQDVEVASFALDRNGAVWNMVLPMTDLAPALTLARRHPGLIAAVKRRTTRLAWRSGRAGRRAWLGTESRARPARHRCVRANGE